MNINKSKVYRCADCNFIFSEVARNFMDLQATCPRCEVYGVKRCLEQPALAMAAEQRGRLPKIKTRVYTFSGYDGLMKARFETEENLLMFRRHAHPIFYKNPVVAGEVWLSPCSSHPNTWDVSPDSPTNAGRQLRNFVSYSAESSVQTTCYGHYLDMTEDMARIAQASSGPALRVAHADNRYSSDKNRPEMYPVSEGSRAKSTESR